MKYAYYPGCSLETTAREYGLSARAVCQRLGVELTELPDWSCCGASSGHSTNYRLAHALAGRNLAIAEKEGLDIAVACPACFLRLKNTQYEVRGNSQLRENVAEIVGLPYEARYNVRHLLDIICNEVGIEIVRTKVTKPLAGLRLVSYYGCFLVRPPKVVAFDEPENPQSIDKLLNALGAEVVDWSGKVDCCGGSLSLTKKDVAAKLVGELIDAACGVRAEALVTACPLCQSNLDSRQNSAGRRLPVFYFTELAGLAMGDPGARGWFKKHLIDPSDLLTSHGLL
ncbi:CoB--CoM heterodisulfide reductase iron-sulfur subunit B family protein [Chloroflexota bacterium]